MKRLFFLCATIAIVGVASAATTKWQYYSTAPLKAGYTGSGTSSAVMEGATLYLFCADTLSQDSLLTALRNGSTISALGSLATATSDSAGKVTLENATIFDSTAFKTDGTTYSFYTAVIAKDSDDKDWVYLSASKSNIAPNTNPDVAKAVIPVVSTSTTLVDSLGTQSFSAGGWYSVPEPTSGMLLMLGVGLMALKRKRA